jgi:uncharacterized protein
MTEAIDVVDSQAMDGALILAGTPVPLRPSGAGSWHVDGVTVTGTASARTDLFVDPADRTRTLNAPRAHFQPVDGDFQIRARVDVRFTSIYDAGVLLLWADDTTWAKLCYELSPQRVPTIVSVVTRGVSDDANHFETDGGAVWLRIARWRGAYAFHASTDGSYWRLVRYFSLGAATPEVGLEVQSPTGDGATATFTDVVYRPDGLSDLRDGT